MLIRKALIFSINGIKLGMDLIQIQEVLLNFSLVKSPESPDLLRGFAQLGKDIHPIIRLEQLLHLELDEEKFWNPEQDLHSKILLLRTADQTVGFYIDNQTDFIEYSTSQLVKMPSDHVLNDCVNYIIPRPPPETSIVLLESEKLLLTKERQTLRELKARELKRLEPLESSDAVK